MKFNVCKGNSDLFRYLPPSLPRESYDEINFEGVGGIEEPDVVIPGSDTRAGELGEKLQDLRFLSVLF